jgi:hypothetical protein
MKKLISKILVSSFVIVIIGIMAFSQTYTITRITDNVYDDRNPRMNNNDTIVWEGKPDVPYWAGNEGLEIFLYDGSSIIRLTDNGFEDSNPQINDNDYVVWQGYDGNDFEIFLYDGSTIIQLTDNGYTDVSPQIDNNNNVVWRRYYTYYECSNNDIFIYDGSDITKINTLTQCNRNPQINNHGHVLWARDGCWRWGVACVLCDADLFLYDGVSTLNLTNRPDRREVNPQINDNDDMVWTEDIGGYKGQEVFLYDGSTTTRLTYNDYHDMHPQINNNGYVTWMGPYSSEEEEIYLYDGSAIIQLTDNLYPDNYPQINNSNYVVWQGRPGADWAGYEIFLYNGSSTMRLTEDNYIDLYPQINDNGSIAWNKILSTGIWVNWKREIYLAIPDQVHSTEIQIPATGETLQDSITLTAAASGFSGTPELYMYVREPDGSYGVPIGYEDLAATLNTSTGNFEYTFDTTILQDGNYIIFAKAIDSFGNEILSEVVPFSIRNWAVIELLPATKNNKAGRTMPVKFSIRIAENVNPTQPFVRNEELEVRIFDKSDPESILQISRFGINSQDYRIDSVNEHYITNFKTKNEPAEYRVEIWRLSQDFLIGSFTFETVK